MDASKNGSLPIILAKNTHSPTVGVFVSFFDTMILMNIYRIICVGLLIFCVQPALAYVASEHTSDIPYEIFSIDTEIPYQQYFMGTLDGFPEMYEMVFAATTTLSLEIRAIDNSSPESFQLAGIIIRDKTVRGVEEIARLQADDTLWEQEQDILSALPYFAGSSFNEVVPPGTYRVEISTPNNLSKYILVFGDDAVSAGYGTALESVANTYSFYGVSKIGMIRSPLLFYPLGIVVLVCLIAGTWYWQRRPRISHA